MHDREKSHSAIVAAKPTNKAGAPAAEPVIVVDFHLLLLAGVTGATLKVAQGCRSAPRVYGRQKLGV